MHILKIYSAVNVDGGISFPCLKSLAERKTGFTSTNRCPFQGRSGTGADSCGKTANVEGVLRWDLILSAGQTFELVLFANWRG